MQIPVSAKNANGTSFLPNSAGIAMISEATETAITALNGTRSRLTRRKIAQPGIPRSRENAYQVREALVRPGRAAEQLADGGDQDHQLRGPGVERRGEDRADEAARRC